MSELLCPECSEPLHACEEWRITNPLLVGTPTGSTEDLQGVYAHARCIGGAA